MVILAVSYRFHKDWGSRQFLLPRWRGVAVRLELRLWIWYIKIIVGEQ